VPIVDVGPKESQDPNDAEVDLTLALNDYLGTDGKAIVSYRVLT